MHDHRASLVQMLSRCVMRWAGLGGLALVLGVLHIWLNIERVDLAYRYRDMEEELQRKATLIQKLHLERDNLLSPYRLKDLAGKLGLAPAAPGQIRKLPPAGENVAQNGN